MTKHKVKLFNADNVMESSIPEPNSGCWIWTGSVTWDGYGQFNYKENGRWRKARAHRASYKIFISDPGSLIVCHRCDNPLCVNPAHLFVGTQLDNVRDMDAKGRRCRLGLKGQQHPNAALTEDEAYAIRFHEYGTTQQIALRYGVSWDAVKSIQTGRTWRHLCLVR